MGLKRSLNLSKSPISKSINFTQSNPKKKQRSDHWTVSPDLIGPKRSLNLSMDPSDFIISHNQTLKRSNVVVTGQFPYLS